MDEATLLAHRAQWVTEPDPTSATLTHLTAAEQSLYQSLLNGRFGERLRLEQEFIGFAAVVAAARVISNDDFEEGWTAGRPSPLPSQLVHSSAMREELHCDDVAAHISKLTDKSA